MQKRICVCKRLKIVFYSVLLFPTTLHSLKGELNNENKLAACLMHTHVLF